MKRTVTEYEFVNAFDEMDRGHNFSRAARFALYEYLTDLEDDCGIEIELDVIALCCEFTEYESLEELIEAFYDEDDEQPDYIEDVALMLEDCTTVIRVEKIYESGAFESLIVQDF